MGVGDDGNGRESGQDWVEVESMETSPLSSARSVGRRASERQHVGGDELPLNTTHLGVLTRASKLNMNDEE